MQAFKVGGVTLHWRSDGPEDAPALVFSNSLGTDLRIWDPLIPHLPQGCGWSAMTSAGTGSAICRRAREAWATMSPT